MSRCRTSTVLAALCGTFCGTLAGARAVEAQAPALASYDSAWAAVSRSYWDTTLVAGRWRAVRDSLRAGLGDAPDAAAVRAAIRALIAVPRQSHFVLMPGSAAPVGGRSGNAAGTVGLEVRIVDRAVIAWRVAPDGAAYRGGLRAGDRITQLDTVRFDTLQSTLRQAANGDTTAADHLLATYTMARLAGGVDEAVTVHFTDARGRRREVSLLRTPVRGTVTQYGNLPPFVVLATGERLRAGRRDQREIAVVRFNAWFPAIVPSLDSILFAQRDAAGLILDLRGNPGGVVAMIAGIAGHMLDTAVSLGVLKSRSGTIRFVANPRLVDRGGRRTAPFTGPVAILVDEFSASTSEFFAAGMQALGRARVFGTRSAGQALPAAMGRLPSGDVLMHVIADHEDAKGRRIEGVGVVPDTPAPVRVADLRAGRDAALEAARAWIAAGAP